MKSTSDECHWTLLMISQHLVQVMVWCHEATSHYLIQCWPSSPTPYGITRPQLVNVNIPDLCCHMLPLGHNELMPLASLGHNELIGMGASWRRNTIDTSGDMDIILNISCSNTAWWLILILHAFLPHGFTQSTQYSHKLITCSSKLKCQV